MRASGVISRWVWDDVARLRSEPTCCAVLSPLRPLLVLEHQCRGAQQPREVKVLNLTSAAPGHCEGLRSNVPRRGLVHPSTCKAEHRTVVLLVQGNKRPLSLVRLRHTPSCPAETCHYSQAVYILRRHLRPPAPLLARGSVLSRDVLVGGASEFGLVVAEQVVDVGGGAGEGVIVEVAEGFQGHALSESERWPDSLRAAWGVRLRVRRRVVRPGAGSAALHRGARRG